MAAPDIHNISDAAQTAFTRSRQPYYLIPVRDLPAIVRRCISSGASIGLDVEATGVDPWTNKPICIQLGDERGVFIADLRYLDTPDLEHLAETVRLLISGRLEVVGHNLKFDLLTLSIHVGVSPDELRPLRLYDTMLAEQVILGGVDAPDGSGRERANLQATAARYGIELTKDPRSWFVNLDSRSEWNEPLPEEQLVYAARDIAVLSSIRANQATIAMTQGLDDTLALEMACAPAVIALELAGVQVDVPGWRHYLEDVQRQADALESRIQTALFPAFCEAKRREHLQQTQALNTWQAGRDATLAQARAHFDTLPNGQRPRWADVRHRALHDYTAAHPRPPTPLPLPEHVNLGSPAQLQSALLLVGVSVADTRAETLEVEAKRRPDVPALTLLCQWRKLNKLLNAFGKNVLCRVQRDGRLHPSWRQIGGENQGVATGRMSCSSPNLQQLPRDDGSEDSIRRHIVAAPGHALVACDFSQMEPRILADVSGDAALASIFADGADLYTSIATQMGLLPADATKDDAKRTRLPNGTESVRDAAKTIVLATMYGMGPQSLAAKLGCTENEARGHLDGFFAAFPGVAHYRKITARQAVVTGYSSSVGGRQRVFRALPKPQPYQFATWEGFRAAQQQWRIDESKMRRQAVNHTIQGTGADILKMAIVLTFQRLPSGCHLVAAVHDELIVEAPDHIADEAARVLKSAMEEAARWYLPTVALGDFHADIASYWRKS